VRTVESAFPQILACSRSQVRNGLAFRVHREPPRLLRECGRGLLNGARKGGRDDDGPFSCVYRVFECASLLDENFSFPHVFAAVFFAASLTTWFGPGAETVLPRARYALAAWGPRPTKPYPAKRSTE